MAKINIYIQENSAFLTGNNAPPPVPNQNPDSPDNTRTNGDDDDINQDDPTSPTEARSIDNQNHGDSQQAMPNFLVTSEGIQLQTIQISVDHISEEERRKSISPCPSPGPNSNFNLLTLPTNVDQRSSNLTFKDFN